jgi:hypothetical protein
MYKVFHFIARKPHLTHEQFREHFERSHAAMALKYFGHVFTDYRRHYITTAMSGGDPRLGDGSFREHASEWDLISEWTTATREDFDMIQQQMVEPKLHRYFYEDEERFIHRQTIMMVPVEASYSSGTAFDPKDTVFDTPSGEPSWDGWEDWQPLGREPMR